MSGAGPKQDWFAPTTETRLVLPEPEDAPGSKPPVEEMQTASATVPDADPAEAGHPRAEQHVPAADDDLIHQVTAHDEAGDAIPAAMVEPVEGEPTVVEPAIAEPIDAEWAEIEPSNANPTAAEPAEAQPIDADAVEGTAHAEPVQTTPVDNGPPVAAPGERQSALTEPADAELVDPHPAYTGPIEPHPAHTDAVDAELVDPHPFRTEPFQAESGRAESVHAEPTDAELFAPQPAQPAPTEADQAEVDPVRAESAHIEPIDAEVIDAEVIDAEPATTEPTSTASADPIDAEIIDAEIIEPATAEPADANLTDAEPVSAEPAAGTESAAANPDLGNDERAEPEPPLRPADQAEPSETTRPANPEAATPEAPTPEAATPEAAPHAGTTHPRTGNAVPETPSAPLPTQSDSPQPQSGTPSAPLPTQCDPPPPQSGTPSAPPPAQSDPPPGNAALRAPSMQLPTLNVPPPPQPDLEPERRRADPEQVLAAFPWKFDPVTLRETVEDPEPLLAIRDRLTDKLEYAERDTVRARLLSLRAVVSRVLGDLGRALADAREALRHAEATGELRRTAIVQARLAHVQQWRGDFGEADRLFEEANSVELPDRLRAEMHVHAGKSAYEQGRYLEACNHFEAALELRRVADPDLVTRTEAALDAVMDRVREAGWGPYPRSREEILEQSRPPHPAVDYNSGWQGYADSDGVVVIPERYAEAQPFHEGVAWVRRPGTAAWELIDETGSLVIEAASGYVQAGRFADGLAWVSREPAGGWFAVDWHNRVIVPGGFSEARPFRHGLAVVRGDGWGAIDRHGRVVVPLKYQRFATELTAGGPVEGFTGDGLAVIDAGDRLGVVDRTGQLVVAPVHARLLIHPVGFVVADRDGRWGALDRNGDPIVEVTRTRPGDVVDEIEKLLSDIRPVL